MPTLRTWSSCILVLIVGFGVWLLLATPDPAGGTDPGVPPAPTLVGSGSGGTLTQPSPGASSLGIRTAEVREEPPASNGGVPHEALVLVRSAPGIPLQRGEFQTSVRALGLESGNSGELVVPRASLPGTLVVPGHVPVRIDAFVPSVEVEPDALVILESPGLRRAVQSLGLVQVGNDEGAAASTSGFSEGFIGPDAWAVAVDARRTGPGREAALQWELAMLQGDSVHLTLRPSPGLRVRLAIPIEADKAPLQRSSLRVVAAAPDGGPLRLLDGPVEFLLTMPEGPTALWHSGAAEWGTVQVLAPFVHRASRTESPEGVVFKEIPEALPLVVTALAPRTRAHGRLTFQHDGRRRAVELLDGHQIVGRFAPIPTNLPREVSIEWEACTSADVFDAGAWPSQGARWFGVVAGAVDPSTGEFQASIPDRVPLESDAPWPMPDLLRARIVGGDGTRRTIVTRRVGTRYDVGRIEFSSTEPHFVLADGHGLAGERMDERALRAWLSSPAIVLTIERVLAAQDGSLGLRFTAAPSDSTRLAARDALSGDLLEVKPGDLRPDAIVVEAATEDGRCFARRADGAYERIDTRPVELRLALRTLPPGFDVVECGWSWRGIDVPLYVGTGRNLPVDHVHRLELPHWGVQTWSRLRTGLGSVPGAESRIPMDQGPTHTIQLGG